MNWLGLLDDISNDNYDKYILPKLSHWLFVNDLYDRMRGGWWPPQGSNPPWTILTRPCTVQRKHDGLLPDGLLLIERRCPYSYCTAGDEGRQQIKNAIAGVNNYLCDITGSAWGLSIERHYRLSNRVAWAWRLTHLGIPVILFYEGYQESSHEEVVASDWWGQWLDIDNVNGTTTRLLLLPRDYSSTAAVEETRRRLSLR